MSLLIDENYDEELGEILNLSRQEIERRQAAKQMYIDEGHPEPKRKIVGFWDIVNIFGLEIVLRVASTIGAALVSATAVGAVMEITMIKLSQVFTGSAEIVSTRGIFYWSMLAFEGGLMASGMTAGRKNDSLVDSKVSMWAGFAVTITAGILRSLTLLGNDSVEFGLAIVFGIAVGVAGPAISYYGAENFGYILKEIQGLQDKFDVEWHSKLEEFASGFRAEFPRIAKQVFGEDRRLRVRYEEESGGSKPGRSRAEELGVQDRVRAWLEERNLSPHAIGDKPGDLATPLMIATDLQIMKNGKIFSGSVRTALDRLRKKMS